MEFNDTFEIADTTREEAWLALSDPVMIKEALPGCQFLMRVESEDVDFDELRERATDDDPPTLPAADTEDIADRAFEEGAHYAALMEIGVGSVKPSFETVVTITEREFAHMSADGQGDSNNSSFELEAGMELEETENGVAVDWHAQTDVFGRIAQMGQRVINPVANRVVNRFFGNIEDQLRDVETDDSGGLRDKIRDML